MISEKMTQAINDQINAEMYSAYLYLSMSAWYSDKTLNGFAQWFRVQAQEEMEHAMKMYDYLMEQGARVKVKAIDGPPTDFESPLAIAKEQLKHEQKVTSLIHNLVSMAREENDYATEIFMQWFVTEQVEEEANAQDIVDKLERVGESGHAIYLLDREMGSRQEGAGEE